ncbi:iduronate 2-sulfatase isoform X2 [Bacillus rossius redtenbacheri]|uniref:iduronate 2-sulfatase isoform X2 n=1 Tax=Bacillus rossius redtenbacheri TaxID=93214 RepID=UPI002FDD4F2C
MRRPINVWAVTERGIIKFFYACVLFVIIVESREKFNVLLVIADDLRPALGCYEDKNAFSPHIDSFAKKSILFYRAYAQQALCAPSRNSLLTGRRPDTLHLYDFYSYWRDVAGNFTTLPQHFKDNGYHTMSIGKVFHPGVSSNWTDDAPYSWSQPAYHPPTEQFKEWPVCLGEHGRPERAVVCPVEVRFQPGRSLPDLQVLQEAASFLERGQRFLLAVGFHKPHLPLKYPRRYLDHHPLDSVSLPKDRWRPATMPTVAWNPWTDLRERNDVARLNLTFPFDPMPDRYSRMIRQSYYAATTYIDDLFGQLMDKLISTGHSNDTIVLLTGDHGWSMGEHGEWSKYSNFEVAVRVPFILFVPGVTSPSLLHTHRGRPSSSPGLAELVDVFPTLADLAGVPLPRLCPEDSSAVQLCTEGVSLRPLVEQAVGRGGRPDRGWKAGVFSQYPRPGTFPTRRPNSDKPRLKDIAVMGYSLRTPDHRYTEWVQFADGRGSWDHVLARELYDHRLDPGEDVNLVNRPQLGQLVDRLSSQLRAGWRMDVCLG